MHDRSRTSPQKGLQVVSDTPRLSRSLPNTPAAAPVRIVHLGIGNFHRAHQAWYTAHTPDAAQWGIGRVHRSSGRHGRSAWAPRWALHLITRSADGDAFELVGASNLRSMPPLSTTRTLTT